MAYCWYVCIFFCSPDSIYAIFKCSLYSFISSVFVYVSSFISTSIFYSDDKYMLSHSCIWAKTIHTKKKKALDFFPLFHIHSFQFSSYSSRCHFGNCYFHLKIMAKTFLRGVTVLKCQVK